MKESSYQSTYAVVLNEKFKVVFHYNCVCNALYKKLPIGGKIISHNVWAAENSLICDFYMFVVRHQNIYNYYYNCYLEILSCSNLINICCDVKRARPIDVLLL